MRRSHRWLTHIVLVCLLASLLPAQPTQWLPSPVAAQTIPASASATLPPPILPEPALPLPALAVPAVPPEPAAPLLLADSISVGTTAPPPTTTLNLSTPTASTCTGDAANPWAWWMRDSNKRFEYVDRSNVDFTDLAGGAGVAKRLYTTDVQAGVALCLRPTQDGFTPNVTQWTVRYFRSATLAGPPTILFATVVTTYRGTDVVNGTACLAFSVSLNGQPAPTRTSQCTAVIAICYLLNPLSVQGTGMNAFPGAWNAQVTRTSGAAQPDLPVIMRQLKPLVYSASPNPINRPQPTVMTATFAGLPATGWMNTDGGLGYFHLYRPDGTLVQRLPGEVGSRDNANQTITYQLDWNNQIGTPSRPITDGTYLLCFLFAQNQPSIENNPQYPMEYAVIQMIWPLYVGVPASQLRNKGSCEYGCSPASYQVVAGDPVNTASGNFTMSATDLAIPTLGEPVAWTRSYNSHGLSEASLLGAGWTNPYQMRMIGPQDPEGIANQVTFAGPSGNRYTFRQQGGSWQPLPGIYARLTSDATGYTLMLPSNAIHRFDLAGTLTQMIDPQGHGVTLSYYPSGAAAGQLERVADSTNQRFLTLTYTGTTTLDRRIATVTDPLNRVIRYGYDPNGVLMTVTDPLNGVTRYTTEAGLITAVLINGERQLTNQYERHVAQTPDPTRPTLFAGYTMADWPPATFRRVITQTNGLGVQTVYRYTPTHTLVSTNDGRQVWTEKHTYRTDGSLDRIEHQTMTGWVTTERAQFNAQTLGRTTTTDRYGTALRQATNALGQTTALTDAANGSVAMTYNPPTPPDCAQPTRHDT